MKTWFLNCNICVALWSVIASIFGKLLCFIKKPKKSRGEGFHQSNDIPFSIQIQGDQVSYVWSILLLFFKSNILFFSCCTGHVGVSFASHFVCWKFLLMWKAYKVSSKHFSTWWFKKLWNYWFKNNLYIYMRQKICIVFYTLSILRNHRMIYATLYLFFFEFSVGEVVWVTYKSTTKVFYI